MSLPVLIATCLLGATQELESYELTVKLKAVGQTGDYKGELLPTGQVDAHWFVQFEVEKVNKGKCPGSSGKVVTYAIHSPSISYGADLSKERVGESFEIKGSVQRNKETEIHVLTIRGTRR